MVPFERVCFSAVLAVQGFFLEIAQHPKAKKK